MTEVELAQIKLRHHVATDGWTCATCLTGINGWTGDEVFAPYPCDAARLVSRVEELERVLGALD